MTLRRTLDAMPKGVPLPSHRHATPSGPWPWMDVDSEETHHQPQATPCPHLNCGICPQWSLYPQSHFPNWTPDQVQRCKIAPFITSRQHNCRLYHVDIQDQRGLFVPQEESPPAEFHLTNDRHIELWEWLKLSVSFHLVFHFCCGVLIPGHQSRPAGLRARALFVDNMSGPALQILGARSALIMLII
jgi:hypothetical protein